MCFTTLSKRWMLTLFCIQPILSTYLTVQNWRRQYYLCNAKYFDKVFLPHLQQLQVKYQNQFYVRPVCIYCHFFSFSSTCMYGRHVLLPSLEFAEKSKKKHNKIWIDFHFTCNRNKYLYIPSKSIAYEDSLVWIYISCTKPSETNNT